MRARELGLAHHSPACVPPVGTATSMPRFYFHQNLNGRLAEDRLGVSFASADEACAHAVHSTATVLGGNVRPTADTFLATEVSDGKRTLFVVRAAVVIQKNAG
jgi:hypothetical protein